MASDLIASMAKAVASVHANHPEPIVRQVKMHPLDYAQLVTSGDFRVPSAVLMQPQSFFGIGIVLDSDAPRLPRKTA